MTPGTISKCQECLIDPTWEVGLQIEWQESLPKYSDLELLEIFPEARQFYERELELCLAVEKKLDNGARGRFDLIKDTAVNEITDWFRGEIVKEWWIKDLLKVKKRIAFLRMMLFPNKNKDGITAADIEKARKWPNQNIWDLAEANSNGFAKCRFHQESTGSMHCWKDRDGIHRFHCFGCGEKGDIVDFITRIEKLNFIEAVRRLI